MPRPFVFIDCETTGLDPSCHEIIEVAAILTDPALVELDRVTLFVQPTRLEEAQAVALELTGFDEEVWRDRGAVALEEALRQLSPLLEGAIPAGHFVSFDLGFLRAAYQRVDLEVPRWSRRSLDTVELAWPLAMAGLIERRRLIDVARALDIPHARPHSAVCDVEATLEVARRLMARYTSALSDLHQDAPRGHLKVVPRAANGGEA